MDNAVKLKIEVGAIPSVLELKNHDYLQDITAFLGPFTTTKEPVYRIKVDMGNGRGVSGEPQGVNVSYSNDIYKVEAGEFQGLLNCKDSCAQIKISSSWPSEALVCALVNMYCFIIVVQEGGVVLHASGVVKANKAYIFAGSSGSGKSTVAGASSGCKVLSEELIGIIPEADTPKAFPVPYTSDIKFSDRISRNYDIAGLFKLVKDNNNYIREISRSRALVDFFTLPSGLRRFVALPDYLSRFNRLTEQIPCYELHFLPENSFWRCIDEQVSKVS